MARQFNEERVVFSTTCTGATGYLHANNESSYLTQFAKINTNGSKSKCKN